jgi:hypothetical protein
MTVPFLRHWCRHFGFREVLKLMCYCDIVWVVLYTCFYQYRLEVNCLQTYVRQPLFRSKYSSRRSRSKIPQQPASLDNASIPSSHPHVSRCFRHGRFRWSRCSAFLHLNTYILHHSVRQSYLPFITNRRYRLVLEYRLLRNERRYEDSRARTIGYVPHILLACFG